jgi:2,3-dihydroxybiphenyl 1,2-dioxygenase
LIKTFSYVLVNTPKLNEWRDFAQETLGLQVVDLPNQDVIYLRIDEKAQRFVIAHTDGPASLTLGYETQDAQASAQVEKDLTNAGFKTVHASAQELELRQVTNMFHFQDPDGRRVEIAYGLKDDASPFKPARPNGGFYTGDLGMGHIALTCNRFEAMCALYKDVLHFELSDYAKEPFPVEFMHCNPRHHTIGLADPGVGVGVYHLMLEYKMFDDLGRVLDIALRDPESIRVTLGRHSNDYMTSFYVRSPDDWLIELGWGGRLIGSEWRVSELPGLSLWGHDRKWLPQAKREVAREQLAMLANAGIRAPNPNQPNA